MYGCGKRAVIFPYKPIKLQPPNRVIDRENREAAVRFPAGTQGAARIDSRNAAKAFDTLHMRVSVYGNCTTEAFGCHAQFTSVKLNMMQMPVRQ